MTTREEEAVKLEEEANRTLTTLPEPEAEIVAYENAPIEVRQEIERRMGEIDLRNSQTIIKFGSGAQQKLTAISDQMLEGVRNQDMGPAGEALRNMMGAIRGFDASELDPDMKRSWW
ncbi:MAG TPA: toxic anion resistance protein, partial [Paracoccaceae bacterium]|nr:toxic anion resistance protein [Paracoccaceae bacterium]